jgi:hypothetical protein
MFGGLFKKFKKKGPATNNNEAAGASTNSGPLEESLAPTPALKKPKPVPVLTPAPEVLENPVNTPSSDVNFNSVKLKCKLVNSAL